MLNFSKHVLEASKKYNYYFPERAMSPFDQLEKMNAEDVHYLTWVYGKEVYYTIPK